MKFLIELEEGRQMPRWYGMAWHNWYRGTAVCAPVPFHLLIRLGRDAYYGFMWLWGPSKWELKIRDAVEQGRQIEREIRRDEESKARIPRFPRESI